MLAAEPAESTDAMEPADPIDRIDPAEPMDRIDPAEPMDRIDPLDPMLKMEPSVFRMRSFSQCRLSGWARALASCGPGYDDQGPPMTARNTTSASGLPTRDRLAAEAARMFAQRGYHGTSINDLAAALGIQKSSLYAHISHKADLLADIALAGAAAFHTALDALPDTASAGERRELALRAEPLKPPPGAEV